MEPVTRKELFLAKAAGQKVQTPTPVTREEYFIDQISANMPCGDMPTGGDTLYWDGNTEGLLSVEIPGLGTYVKVSDVAPTWDEAYGVDGKFYPVAILYDDTGVELGEPQDCDELQACTDDIVRQVVAGAVELGPMYHCPVTCYADWVIAVLEDNVEIGPFAFPEKGIYFKVDGDARAFKLQGYTGFPGVKQIDPKYIPTYGVFLELGEADEAGDNGDIPNWNDDLTEAVASAFDRGEPVRCMLDIGFKVIFTASMRFINNLIVFVLYDAIKLKHRIVEVSFEDGTWNYYIEE